MKEPWDNEIAIYLNYCRASRPNRSSHNISALPSSLLHPAVEYDEAEDVDKHGGEHFRKFQESDPYYGHLSNASYSRAGEVLKRGINV